MACAAAPREFHGGGRALGDLRRQGDKPGGGKPLPYAQKIIRISENLNASAARVHIFGPCRQRQFRQHRLVRVGQYAGPGEQVGHRPRGPQVAPMGGENPTQVRGEVMALLRGALDQNGSAARSIAFVLHCC